MSALRLWTLQESLPWRPYANMRQKASSSGRNRLRTKSLFDEDDDYLSQ